ncbi:pyridoxal phosphate-dependent aminotransferase [Glaciecola petra]|uniref:Histidinol-phosphate transaminase n=1 Tax=Glaciecola petra TaxID=3075602 RepID=A0ABU2ZUR8_9ALTE|nr:histidinol-phosphate transaminase [Aestuariibacter sp. P117]MDT0596386.1 histidinol-phosphate transaminase [Aestuariibacter sp. P117]
MQSNELATSRRHFLKTLSTGLAVAGTSLYLPPIFAAENADLILRKNAPLMQLHFNENSFGMSPKAITAAKEAIERFGNRYPDAAVDELKAELANHVNLPIDQLIMGNGSTEMLGAVVNYANSQGTTVVEPNPTFGDLRSRAEALGMQVIRVDVDESFNTNIQAMQKQISTIKGNVLINLCNPNNPTGTIVDKGELNDWIMNSPPQHMFLIDEAYHEYALANTAYESALPLIKEGRENVVVTRTFSKIYGLAGMRVGYAMAAPATAKKIDALATSFNLSIAGTTAAIASLKDKAFFQKSIASNKQAKTILTNTLNALNLEYVNSNTNFVLHQINADLASYSQHMKENNILVGRRMTAQDGWNRVSIGTPDEMQEFAKTLLLFREKGWV